MFINTLADPVRTGRAALRDAGQAMAASPSPFPPWRAPCRWQLPRPSALFSLQQTKASWSGGSAHSRGFRTAQRCPGKQTPCPGAASQPRAAHDPISMTDDPISTTAAPKLPRESRTRRFSSRARCPRARRFPGPFLPWFLMASWEEHGAFPLGFSSSRASAAAAALCASSVGAWRGFGTTSAFGFSLGALPRGTRAR